MTGYDILSLGSRTQQHGQHAGSVRVESAGVADLLLPYELTHHGDYVKGCKILLFIYQDDAVHLRYSSAASIIILLTVPRSPSTLQPDAAG